MHRDGIQFQTINSVVKKEILERTERRNEYANQIDLSGK